MTAKDDRATAELLAELERLHYEADTTERANTAWRALVGAAANRNFTPLVDFALEHGLVLPADADPSQRIDGQRVGNRSWINPLDGSEMVWIPPGSFFVGEDKERATCAGFSLARHPVTNAQFGRFLDETSYAPADETATFLQHWTKGRPPRSKAEHPVVWVSYVDALHYCRWAGLSLPTEWLWEKAARGPDGRVYPWGNQPPAVGDHLANWRGKDTQPVGRHPRARTPYGCEDLIGNVAEWCQTSADYGRVPETWATPQPDPDDAEPYAAVRGGCYLRTQAGRLVSWHRRRLGKNRRNAWVGFRPAFLVGCRPC